MRLGRRSLLATVWEVILGARDASCDHIARGRRGRESSGGGGCRGTVNRFRSLRVVSLGGQRRPGYCRGTSPVVSDRSGGPVQLFLIDPEARIEDSDIVVAIFGRRIGTAIGAGMETGTVHEFQTAVRGFRARGLPHIMAYFKKGTLTSEDPDDLEQYAAVLRFKRTLPPNSLHGEYLETGEFKSRFGKHLPGVLCQVRDKRSRLFTKEGFLAYVRDAEPTEDVRPKILGNVDSDTTFPRSSFSYGAAEKPFWRLNVSTTSGYVPGVPQAEEEYTIYLISDPIRPFEIQIGKLRAQIGRAH